MGASAQELACAGLVWVRGPSGLIASVRGTAEQTAYVQAEVARRAPTMLRPPVLDTPRTGACDACGEAMEAHRAGWCELCELARKVALKKRGVAL